MNQNITLPKTFRRSLFVLIRPVGRRVVFILIFAAIFAFFHFYVYPKVELGVNWSKQKTLDTAGDTLTSLMNDMPATAEKAKDILEGTKSTLHWFFFGIKWLLLAIPVIFHGAWIVYDIIEPTRFIIEKNRVVIRKKIRWKQFSPYNFSEIVGTPNRLMWGFIGEYFNFGRVIIIMGDKRIKIEFVTPFDEFVKTLNNAQDQFKATN